MVLLQIRDISTCSDRLEHVWLLFNLFFLHFEPALTNFSEDVHFTRPLVVFPDAVSLSNTRESESADLESTSYDRTSPLSSKHQQQQSIPTRRTPISRPLSGDYELYANSEEEQSSTSSAPQMAFPTRTHLKFQSKKYVAFKREEFLLSYCL